MNPAWSIVLFTTLAGSAQGLVVVLAAVRLVGLPLPIGFVSTALAFAVVVLTLALGASFFHLGHPMRAWRAVLMWRTSWMSREVIVLPGFLALVAAWAAALATHASIAAGPALPLLALLMSGVLWYCTAMIYASLRFIQEWAHPLTIVNYTLIGISSGLVLAGALGVIGGEPAFARAVGPWAVGSTLLAWAARALALRRNARLVPISTLQSATGIRSARLVQKSMGMSGGSFNTREFFHHVSIAGLRHVRLGFQLFGFALPSLLVAFTMMAEVPAVWLTALLLQTMGLMAERWFFFAQANHPQNLYYQTIS